MQTPQLKMCTDCGTLQNLYEQINCSIFQFIKNKWTNQSYNTSNFFSDGGYKKLLRLKRIVYKRMFNQLYPNSKYSNQDIISLVSRNLYKQGDCQDCPCEDFTDFITPCKCYSVENRTSPSRPSIILSYKDCDGVAEEVTVDPGETVYVCSVEGGVVNDNLIITLIGDCSACDTTTTTTSMLP